MILLDETICIFSGQIFKYLLGESRSALIERKNVCPNWSQIEKHERQDSLVPLDVI